MPFIASQKICHIYSVSVIEMKLFTLFVSLLARKIRKTLAQSDFGHLLTCHLLHQRCLAVHTENISE